MALNTKKPTQRIRITSDEDYRGKIELDGRELRGVRSATLSMSASTVPILSVEFASLDVVGVVEGETRYVAWSRVDRSEALKAEGTDPVAVLRDLADQLEARRGR